MNHWLTLALAIFAEVIGTTFLKLSDGFERWAYAGAAMMAYWVAFYFLALAMRSIPVGVVYAVWSGVGVALITLIGFVFLHEKLSFVQLGGIGLIVAGVIALQLSGNAH